MGGREPEWEELVDFATAPVAGATLGVADGRADVELVDLPRLYGGE
ncbi:hypothetical protein [Nonomuraea glycinis]